MLYLVIKALLSGVIIMLVSEVARRSPGFGALIVSLPLVSLLAILWLWRDTHDSEAAAAQAMSTFWFVLPSLPLFLIIPWLLRSGLNFWLSLAIACVVTMALYAGFAVIAPKLGIRL